MEVRGLTPKSPTSVLVELVCAVLGVAEFLPRYLLAFDSPQRREQLLGLLQRALALDHLAAFEQFVRLLHLQPRLLPLRYALRVLELRSHRLVAMLQAGEDIAQGEPELEFGSVTGDPSQGIAGLRIAFTFIDQRHFLSLACAELLDSDDDRPLVRRDQDYAIDFAAVEEVLDLRRRQTLGANRAIDHRPLSR